MEERRNITEYEIFSDENSVIKLEKGYTTTDKDLKQLVDLFNEDPEGDSSYEPVLVEKTKKLYKKRVAN